MRFATSHAKKFPRSDATQPNVWIIMSTHFPSNIACGLGVEKAVEGPVQHFVVVGFRRRFWPQEDGDAASTSCSILWRKRKHVIGEELTVLHEAAAWRESKKPK